MNKCIFLVLAAVFFSSPVFLCAQNKVQKHSLKVLDKALQRELGGFYDNAAQASEKESPFYAPQEGRICPVPQKTADARYLFLGWFAHEMDQPLLGRIVELQAHAERPNYFSGRVFLAPEEQDYSRTWCKESPFAGLDIERLEEEQAQVEAWLDEQGIWHIETMGENCKNSSGLAGYASFQILLFFEKNQMHSRTRFFQEDGSLFFAHSDHYYDLVYRRKYKRESSEAN